MAIKDKIKLKKIPVFLTRDQAMSDMGVLHTKILLRPDEVASILRVSLSQVYEMMSEGYLQATDNRPKRGEEPECYPIFEEYWGFDVSYFRHGRR